MAALHTGARADVHDTAERIHLRGGRTGVASSSALHGMGRSGNVALFRGRHVLCRQNHPLYAPAQLPAETDRAPDTHHRAPYRRNGTAQLLQRAARRPRPAALVGPHVAGRARQELLLEGGCRTDCQHHIRHRRGDTQHPGDIQQAQPAHAQFIRPVARSQQLREQDHLHQPEPECGDTVRHQPENGAFRPQRGGHSLPCHRRTHQQQHEALGRHAADARPDLCGRYRHDRLLRQRQRVRHGCRPGYRHGPLQHHLPHPVAQRHGRDNERTRQRHVGPHKRKRRTFG